MTVTLSGAAVATAMTANGGQYAFAGLAEGTYVVTISDWDADAYNFETTTATIVLGDSESNITNFEGTHTRTASVSGVLFIDEVMQDKMHTAGEPSITAALAPLVAHGLLDEAMLAGLLANAKVMLRGPDLNTMTPKSTSMRTVPTRRARPCRPDRTRSSFPPTTRWWRRHSQPLALRSSASRRW